MRVKTSVTLPEELLRSLDRAAGGRINRSRLVELAVRQLLEARTRAARDARDVEIIDRHADLLNREAADVLQYQVTLKRGDLCGKARAEG
jgi:metal-responsive CopG/Arc/MetJ family transcriptional regulator